MDFNKSKKKSAGCLILISGFIGWIAILGIVLAIITVVNFKIICATFGAKMFNPVFVQQLDKNLNNSDFITFSNSYFALIKKIEAVGLNTNTIIPVNYIFTSAQDHKITKSELETFSNSVWKTVDGESTNPTIQQSTNPTIQQSNNPTIQQFNNPTIQQSNNPTIQQSTNRTIQQSTNPTIQQSPNLLIPQSTNSPIYQTFSLPAWHFKFLMPRYWEAIPDKELQVYKKLLKETYPKRTENYVLAFQRKALDYFKMPYALVDIRQQKTPTIQEINAEAKNFATKLRKSYVDLYRSNLFGEIMPMDAVYDSEKNVIIEYYRMFRAKDKKYICSMTAVFPCRFGFVNFHFFYKAENETKYIEVIEKIIESVAFEKGYEYIRIDAIQENSYKNVISISVVVLATIWIIMRFMGRRKK